MGNIHEWRLILQKKGVFWNRLHDFSSRREWIDWAFDEFVEFCIICYQTDGSAIGFLNEKAWSAPLNGFVDFRYDLLLK